MKRNRQKQINFRVTEEEYLNIKKNAAKSNMSMQDYLIHSALKRQKIVVLESTEDLKSIQSEIKRIGNNINQIVRLAHTYGFHQRYLNDIRDRQVVILQIIMKLFQSYQKK